MTRAWESFLEEHAHLRARIERLHEVADSVGEVPVSVLRARVEDVYGFLSHQLLPHIAVEERVLYPAIARVEGFREAVPTMSRDHAEVGRYARELAALVGKFESDLFGPEDARNLRRVLYGLCALLKLHMAKEEEICLPLLDRTLSEAQIQAVAEGMELFELAEQAAE